MRTVVIETLNKTVDTHALLLFDWDIEWDCWYSCAPALWFRHWMRLLLLTRSCSLIETLNETVDTHALLLFDRDIEWDCWYSHAPALWLRHWMRLLILTRSCSLILLSRSSFSSNTSRLCSWTLLCSDLELSISSSSSWNRRLIVETGQRRTQHHRFPSSLIFFNSMLVVSRRRSLYISFVPPLFVRP